MKKIYLILLALILSASVSFGQSVFNPFTQNIHFVPEPTVFGFECGSTPSVAFTAGLTTAADATQWQTQPLTITVCLSGFTFNGTASSVVSGSYASNFTWAFVSGNPSCIIGTQNQTLPGTGTNPVFPNPLASGAIELALAVPTTSPVGTVLSVNVTMQVPTYMATYNSVPDDNESTQTQTFCNCYVLTDPGTIAANQSFCVSGDPALFTSTFPASGGAGGTIQYQWQQLIGSTWTDISGATSATYDAPVVSATTQYRRNAKRSLCGSWISSNSLTVTINSLPTANAGPAKNLTCTTTSATIGTAAVSGNTYSWAPATGLNSTSAAQPIASPTSTTIYTVTVTNSNNCSATSTVNVNVNTTPPTADAGNDKNLTCSVTSTTIGTAAVSGNTYSWAPSTALSATNIAQPIASPTTTTNYTVTVTGSNGCTATDVVIVNVNTAPPSANAGPNVNLNCTTTSSTIGTVAISGNSYSWAPSTALSATNVAQPTANPSSTTTYTVTVTGSNGCTATSVVVVNVNTTPPTADAGSDKNLTCSVTSATIGSAATTGYTYSWAPSTALSATNIAQPIASPIVTTSYTVTVTGTNGCTATDVVIVNVNTTPPTANAGPTKNLNCTTTSATIGTTLISGNTYSWAPSTGLSSTSIAQPTASPLSTITYTVTVTGSNGCTATSSVTVNVNTTPPTVDAGVDKNLTCSTTSATIGSTAISGYTYSWSPATALSATNVAQPTASPSTTTSYTVTATGANGCTATDVVVVNVNTTPPTVNAGTDKTLNCTTTSTTIGTTAISGYTYSWSPATALSATNIAQPTANPTATTTYTVTVTGTNGCTATDVVIVNVNSTPPSADAGVDKNLTCSVTSTQIGSPSISGNTYSWAPSTSLSATNIAQPVASPTATTNYTVTVTGTNGCTSTDVVVVNVNTTPPTANAGPTKNLNCTTTSATIGTASISGNTYSWAPSTGLSATNVAQPVASPSSNQTYTVTVTGSNGCTATSSVMVNVNTTPPTTDAGPDKNLTCSVTSATIGTTAVSGNTYSWAPSIGLSATNVAQPIANPSVTTTYTLTVTGANGCIQTDVVVVNVNTSLPTVNAGPDRNLNCITTSTTIGTVAISGYSYSWSPSTALSATNIAQPTANPTSTTTYTVTATGTNGCTATDVVVVDVNTTPPTADAGTDKQVCSSTSTIIGTPALIGNTYSWAPSTGLLSTNIAQPTAQPSVTTSYTVTVTGSNGCTATDVVVVAFKEGSVGNFVWIDNNGDGINNEAPSFGVNGVNVQLWSTLDNIQGNADDIQVAATTTNIDGSGNPGYYNFLVCNSGNYYVKFPTSTNSNNHLTTQTVTAGVDNNSDAELGTGYSPIFVIDLNSSGIAVNNNTIDAGYVPLSSIGNLVWNDNNRNGVKDLTETVLQGALIYLYNDADSNGVPDGAAIANTNSNSSGLYIFNNLVPGNYIVGVIPPTPASGNPFISSTQGEELNPNLDIDNNDNGIVTIGNQTYTGTITLLPGTEPLGETPNNGTSPDANSNLTIDFGFYQPVNIAGNVFSDINGPTNIDGTGLSNPSGSQLYTNLVNSVGVVVATAAVNPDGTYQFVDVTPNSTYTVILSTTQGTIGNVPPTPNLPNGWINVGEDCCDNVGNDGTANGVTTVAVGTSNATNVNFGITEPLSLGNQVWIDANKNGLLDNGEIGLGGAVINLYLDADSNGVPDGASIMNVNSDPDGLYVFNGLNPGNYIIGVTPPSVSGGTYTSSAVGQELNPNLDVDLNDNGIQTLGTGETITGTINLTAGLEPLNEIPNNTTNPDNNSNLTIDFGFFVCPSNFVFTPVSVCAGNFVDLQSLEPAGYTGGVWTNNGNVITNLLVNIGTYVYTYTNGDCIASGTQVVNAQIPDYSPTITVNPAVVNGVKPVRVVVNIAELLNQNSCTPIYVFIPRLEPRFVFTWDPAATQLGNGFGGVVNNPDWTYYTSNPNFYIWSYTGNSTFPAFGNSKFGYIGTYDPNNTDGNTTFSVQIFQGSGGETNQVNNTDSENLIYYRQ